METKNLSVTLEFINEFGDDNEAMASVSLNPNFRWAKIRVCDDMPNANNQRIPVEEFDNLISTGILTPIKMAEGKIAGHAEAKGRPVGVIHSMKSQNNTLDALVAFWVKERPEDIQALEEMYQKGNPPNVSWEIGYTDSEVSEGVQTLKGVQFNGLAIVSNPAYRGRTKFMAMAESDEEYNSEESDSMDELEQLKLDFESLKTSLAEKEAKLTEISEQLDSVKSERDTLAEFKSNIEKEAEKLTKISEIKAKFVEAGVEKEDSYFETNQEMLLGLSENALDFMLQELVSFKSAQAESKTKGNSLPNLNDGKLDNLDLSNPKELAKAYKNLKTIKK